MINFNFNSKVLTVEINKKQIPYTLNPTTFGYIYKNYGYRTYIFLIILLCATEEAKDWMLFCNLDEKEKYGNRS